MAKVANADAEEKRPPAAAPDATAPGAARGLATAVAIALVLGATLGALFATYLPRAIRPEKSSETTHEVIYVPVAVPVGYPVAGSAADLPVGDAPKSKVAAPQASQSGDRLTAERNLLDGARVSLASGEPTEALRLTERHRRDFPAGALVEEREAIATKALVDAHRYAEAKVRGAAFEKRFPQSAMLRSVKSSLTITDKP